MLMVHLTDILQLLRSTVQARVENVYTAHQWYEHVRNAMTSVGSIVEVVQIEQDSFRNYRGHLNKLYTERNKDTDKQPLDFAHATWFNFGKG